MKFYLGVTNNSWYNYLSKINPEDINFWQPGGNMNFRVLTAGAPFLFKLKSPLNAIGGIGFFSSHTFLPLNMAWDTFRNRNGCETFSDLSRMILNHRADKNNTNPTIGCIVLTNPIFFKPEDWIETPADWAGSIVQGKSYDSRDGVGRDIWSKVDRLLEKYLYMNAADEGKSQLILEEPSSPLYGNSILSKVRLGQGAFRVLVTDAYSRRCSISGEKTLPVLESAHIKPYAESGPHFISNALLLRSDLHKLFDSGYVTITKDLKVEVSSKIKEEFQNGKEYYQFHGKDLHTLPNRIIDKPGEKYIDWHNTKVFKG
jgi:putative restriction endonuclease